MSPKRKVKVTVNDKPYFVEVGDLSTSPLIVTVNGHEYTVNVETMEVEKVPTNGAARVPEPTARVETAVRPAKAAVANIPVGAGVKEVRAPMPGHIVDIAVNPGDEVSVGQTLCALEAMKMKNAIRSPRHGVIAAVAVEPNQAVSHGDVLLTFE